MRTEIGSHNDNRVFEIDHSTFVIGKPTVIQNLEKRIEDIRMGFFNLIEEDYGIRSPAHGFGELTALIIAHIPRRRTHQSGNTVALLIFAHIYSGEVILIIKEKLGKCLCKLGFTNPCSPKEEEGADRSFLITKPCTVSSDGICYSLYGFLLTNYSPVKLIF